jgi:hypothetical protein
MATGMTGIEGGVSSSKEKPKITFEVLKVYNEIESRNGLQRLQIIKWGKYKPSLEKREYYDDGNVENIGKEKIGKLKGFKLEDIEIIVNNLDEIKNFLK